MVEQLCDPGQWIIKLLDVNYLPENYVYFLRHFLKRSEHCCEEEDIFCFETLYPKLTNGKSILTIVTYVVKLQVNHDSSTIIIFNDNRIYFQAIKHKLRIIETFFMQCKDLHTQMFKIIKFKLVIHEIGNFESAYSKQCQSKSNMKGQLMQVCFGGLLFFFI